MGVYLQNTKISNIYIGDVKAKSVYLGNELIYSIQEDNDIIKTGLIYYLDGRDFLVTSPSNTKWFPKIGVGAGSMSFTSSATKNGNCVKLSTSVTGKDSSFTPFSDYRSDFTLEYYIKNVGNYARYGLIAGVGDANTLNGFYTMCGLGTDILTCGDNSSSSIKHSSYNNSIHVQFVCSNYDVTLYIDGVICKTFTLKLKSNYVYPMLGGWEGFNTGPTIGCLRFYNRALTKDELDKNRNFDLSIY